LNPSAAPPLIKTCWLPLLGIRVHIFFFIHTARLWPLSGDTITSPRFVTLNFQLATLMRRLLPRRFLLMNAEDQLVFQGKPLLQGLHQQGDPFR